MKKIYSRLLLAVPVVMVLLSVMFTDSCANTTNAPSGGKKDTIPPVIVGLKPLPGSLNVPRNTQIFITFNEYVKVLDPKSIFLSPPQKKAPKYKMHGKTLVVYFEQQLDSNTTYTLDLTNAIGDNNEGNLFPGYTLVFSTGDQIDMKALTGTVVDCNTLTPIKGATVMLYKDVSDSAVFKTLPDYAVKTDEWGFFSLRNIADTSYRLYAIKDEMGDNLFDPNTDLIAFVDSIIHPTITTSDTLKELLKYDMKDTLHCMARNSQYDLFLFQQPGSRQAIREAKRIGPKAGYVSFTAPDVMIDSMWIKGVAPDELITQMSLKRDSVEFWINNRKRLQDTLYLHVDYKKTDSTGNLVPFVSDHRLTLENAGSLSKSSRRNLKHEDTTCVVNVSADPKTVEQYGFVMEFSLPIIYEAFDSVKLKSINPRQQEQMMTFKVTQDTLNLRKYTLMPDEKLQKGYDYVLKVPHRMFRDINGSLNDSTDVKVSLPNDDKLSELHLNLRNVNNRYIVDMLDEKRTNVMRSYIVDSDKILDFPYLAAGKFSIRITEDLNRNGIVDSGDLMNHKMPEKVKFFKLKNGSYVLDIPESMEITQDIDLKALFSN